MTKKDTNESLIKRLLRQISGDVNEKDELIPEVAINGAGEMWCWDPVSKIHKKIYRGVKAFILYNNYDHLNRTLIYTLGGDMVCIDSKELIHTGYD